MQRQIIPHKSRSCSRARHMGTAVHAHVPEIHARMVTMKRNAVGAGKGKKNDLPADRGGPPEGR